jgi:hypothetical protein
MFEFTRASMGKGNYNCPPDAGPAWREASEAGLDMFELEENLRLSPWERLIKHDKKLNELLAFEAFVEKLQRGWKFIQSHYGYSR